LSISRKSADALTRWHQEAILEIAEHIAKMETALNELQFQPRRGRATTSNFAPPALDLERPDASCPRATSG